MTSRLGVVFPAADTRGGVERVVLEVVTRLSRRRPVTFVGQRYEPGPDVTADFQPVSVPAGSAAKAPLRFRQAAAAALAIDRPETVLSFGVNCPPGDVYWVQSVHRAWLESGSAVRLHGIPVPSLARRLLARHRVLLNMEHEYFTAHEPRRILCTSRREVEDLSRLYGVPEARMVVVPNGFDRARFNPESRHRLRAGMRVELGIGDNEISLLFVVNELHRKGFGVLLDAVGSLHDSRVRIDIVGRAAPTQYGGQIARLGLQDRVHWHGPTAEVERYLAAGDLLVLPTQYEPFGLVIVEAMASGVPVVTTALAGAAAAVVPGSGLLQQDPHDSTELADLLAQALTPGVREKWAELCPLAAAPYDWDAVMDTAEAEIFRGA